MSNPKLLNVQNSNPNTKFSQPFNKPGFKRLTPAELDEKRKKNLCFQCGVPYTVCHKCGGKLYHMLLVPKDNNIEEGGDMEEDFCQREEEMVENGEGVNEENQPLISLNVMAGYNAYQTMRVQGKVKDNVIHILIDSGSTHNFCDEQTARKLGCKVSKTYPLEVSVANGKKLVTTKVDCVGGYMEWSVKLM